MKILHDTISLIREYRDKYFFNQSVINPDFLVFFRISIGTFLTLHFLSIFKDFDLLYGIHSIIPADIQSIYQLEYIIFYNDIIEKLNIVTGTEFISVIIFQIVYLVLCMFIVLGLFSRYSAFILLILKVSLMRSAIYYAYGVDYFSNMALMYLVLFPSDDFFSIRNLWRQPKLLSDLTPFKRLFQIHIGVAYFVSGFEKLLGFNWRNGESVWKAIHLPDMKSSLTNFITSWGSDPIIFIFIGWSVIFIELLYPLFINLRKIRVFWLYITIAMHIGIALCLGLYFFSTMMIIWNLTAYYFKPKKS